MSKLLYFVKRHWLILALIFIIFLLIRDRLSRASTYNTGISLPTASNSYSYLNSKMALAPSFDGSRNIAPAETANRIVIQDTNLSLVVKDVSAVITTIELTAKNFGGFLVNSYLSKPESAANGSIVIRVPEEKRAEAMAAFKKMSVKVVSESVSGNDVTDQYVDLKSRLGILNQTKTKYEEIMSKAFSVTDLMTVQRELINLQTEIDNLVGQQKYLEQTAKFSKITIYLSTDELALPYAPSNEWRPAVIFKEAVRSLVGTFRGIGSLLIWVVVYLPAILPILGIIWFVRRRQKLA